MREWFKKPTSQAAALVSVGFALTLLLAMLGANGKLGSWVGAVALATLSGVFQALGAGRFHAIGKADPGLARNSVRQLLLMGARARGAKELAERLYEEGSAAEAKKQMGLMSVHLSTLEEGVVLAIESWREFHGEAVAELVEEAGSDQGAD